MTRWKIPACIGVLALSLGTFGTALAQTPNPCHGPAGAHNPNCLDGQLSPPGQDKGEEPEESFPNLVTIDPPSAAEGTYQASGAVFGPEPSGGVAGDIVLVNDGAGATTDGCEPLIGFPAGAIALVDRGTCLFTLKVSNAQAAGAVAVIVVQNTTADPFTMGGADPAIMIPTVMVSLDDGNVIKMGLPANGLVSQAP